MSKSEPEIVRLRKVAQAAIKVLVDEGPCGDDDCEMCELGQCPYCDLNRALGDLTNAEING